MVNSRLMRLTLGWTAVFVVMGSLVAQATGNFVVVRLPRGVSIELPKNWVVLSSNQRITLDSYIESALDLSGTGQETSDLPFAANLYDDRGRTIGIVNIRYYPMLELSQADARAATPAETQELDSVLRAQLIPEMANLNLNVTSWLGTTKADVGGATAFVTQYERAAKGVPGHFRVRLVRVFAAERSFTLTTSYSDGSEIPLQPIIERIVSSLRFAPPLDDGKTETRESGTRDGVSPSIMTQLYGDHWGATLVLSLLLTWVIGLAPPLITRFVVLRRPMRRNRAIAFAAAFWFVNLFVFVALGSESKTHFALLLIAVASYAILTRPARAPSPSLPVT